MALPGVKVPPCCFPKNGTDSVLKPAPGAKDKTEEVLTMTQTATKQGPAPASRVYTRDYSKGKKDPDQTDLVTAALGNPFRL